MNHNAELAEYGLSFEEIYLVPTKCPSCKIQYTAWPGKDWMYCERCLKGVSRCEIVHPEWLSKLAQSALDRLERYNYLHVDKRKRARSFWATLTQGQSADDLVPRIGNMSKFIRLITTKEEFNELEAMSGTPLVSMPLPLITIRLDDLPGRLTGFLLLSKSKSVNHFQIAKMIHGARVAFLDSVKNPLVIMRDPTLTFEAQCRNFALTGQLLPLVYVDTNNTPWAPDLPTSLVLYTAALSYKDVKLSALAKCHLSVGGSYAETNSLIGASAISWCNHVRKMSAPWDIVISEIGSKMPPSETAQMLINSAIGSVDVTRILNSCTSVNRLLIEKALATQPLYHKLNSTKSVYDDGYTWKAQDGSLILSASFRLTGVSKDQAGNPVYTCKVVTDTNEVDFIAGRELERNAFQVIMRECLVQGVSISFNRVYSKYAIETAIGLRPLCK